MNHDDLDDQIRAALDDEPLAEQLARLERYWATKSRGERRRRRGWRAAALAATVVVAAALSIRQFRPGPAEQIHIAEPARPAEGSLATGAERDKGSTSAGRTPSVYERMVFAAGRRESAAAKSPGLAGEVDALIEALARNPNAAAEELVAAKGLSANNMERLLLRRLSRSADEEKRAVLRLLAVCGTIKSTPALLRLSRHDAFHDAALTTIERIEGVERLAAIAVQSRDRRVRAALIRRLLAVDSAAGLRGFLSIVNDQGTRAEALAIVRQLANPPLTALLAMLDDDDKAVRLSAALVLGRLNGPKVTRALVERVTQKPAGTTEAWIALLACRGELAEEFLAYASRQPQLLMHVNIARARWARIIN